MKYEGSSSSYKTGWYFDEEASNWLKIGSKKPATNASIGISKRPATEKSFTATLRLFSADTSTDIINNVNEASTAALATQEFKITLESAEPNYTMTVKVVDADDNSDLTTDGKTTIKLEKNWTAVSPETDGSYKMEKGAGYTLTVTRDGYIDYKDSYFTFNPTEENTVRTVQLQKKIIRNISFNVTDKSTGNTITGSTVTVKKAGDYLNTIKAEDDGSYKLVNGVTYNYTIEATNYKTVNGSITPDANKTIDIQMEKDISKYNVTFKPVDFKGADIANAKISVTYEEEDDYGYGGTETITPNDGVYTLDKNTTYDYTVEADGYKKATGSYKPSGDEENITVPVLMEAANVSEADQATVEAVKKQFDKEYTLRPKFASCKNICDFVKTKNTIKI